MSPPSLLSDVFAHLNRRRSRTTSLTSILSRKSSYRSYEVHYQDMAPLLILRDPDATKKLLEAILDSPGGKRSLSRLARTCKAICDPALNILWRDLDSIVPLIGLFPNNILKRARRPGLGLSKNPSEQDWVRLLAYGERVRSIAYTESSNNVSTSIFPILEDHRPRTYILPKLTSITWRAETPAGLDRCLIFLNPELKHVTLEIGVRFNNAHDFLVQLSGKTHLSSFSFSSPTHLPDDFTEILRRQTGLEKVSLSAPGALSAQVGKWVASLHKLRSLQLDLTGRGIVAVEGFFDEISPRSGYTTPSSVGGTDSGVFSGEEIDFSDVRKSALRLTGDAPARGVCSQLKQLHLTGEAANIATFLRHLTSRLVQLELVIEDPPDKNDWQDLSNTICEQFAGWLQSLRITATGSSKFTELVRSTSRDVPLRHLPLKHLSLMPRLARFEVDLPESVIFHDSDVAHLARMCPNIEILRLCPVARFTTSPPSLSLEGLTPLTATCRRLHTLAVVVNARETDETQKVLSSSDVSSRSLLRLHFGHSWIKDPFQTSLVLSNLAPHLESLKWFNDKNRAVVEANAQGWQKVSDYLPHLQKLRIGERVAAALAAQQHIPEPPPPPPPAPETCEKAIDATPVMVDSGVLVRPRVADFAVQSSPQLVDEEVEAKPEFHSIEIDATPVIVDQEVLASPTVSDAIIDVRPSTSSQGVDPIIILKADEVIVTDGLPESMSDTSSPSSSTSSSSEDLHPANYVVPSITGMFSFVREVFLCYPLYLSLRLLNVSLATMGAKKPDELLSAEKLTAAALEGDYHGEAESEKRIPMESPDVLLSPLSPRIGDRAAVLDIVPPELHDHAFVPGALGEQDEDSIGEGPLDHGTSFEDRERQQVEHPVAKELEATAPTPTTDAVAHDAEPSYRFWTTETKANINTRAWSTRHSFSFDANPPAHLLQNHRLKLDMAEPKKQEKDFTSEVDVIIPETESLVKSGKLQDAVDKLYALEKQTRNASDLKSTTRLLNTICSLCYEARDYELLNSSINILSKKHGQLKAAIQSMVDQAMGWLEEIKSRDGIEKWLQMVETLRSVTDGKLFLETPRARVTLLLAHYHEALFKAPTPAAPSPKESLITASDLLSDLQVETYSSMERREKTEIILEQMRFLIAVARQKDSEVDADKKESLSGGDAEWVKVRVGGRKVNEEFLKEKDNEDLKLKYYDLMIQHALHQSSYLDVAKYYYKVWETPSIKEDVAGKGRAALEHIVYYVVLAPHDNEQSDMLHRLFNDPALVKLELQYNLVKCFTTSELMRWPGIESIYGPFLRTTSVFSSDKRWEDLHTRVIEHNIRVVAKYYTRITLPRLTSLLDLTRQQTEETLCRLVVSGTIWARIDRPTGVVNFRATRSAEDVMNDWSSDMQKLLGLVEKSWMGMNAAQAAQTRVKAS